MDSIFVQIASYRDTDLPLTIASALSNADHPERLRFGICWQYDERTFTDLDEHLKDARFRIAQFHYAESGGCCWARHQTNQLYRGETYTLQIDAHTRFADSWDTQYVEMIQSLPVEKPILTTYPAPFELQGGVVEKKLERTIQKLVLKKLADNLITVLKTRDVDSCESPEPSQFLAAGQIFTVGQFCREVEYDPQMYYAGEEISLSARAYTSGYDLFCPNKHLIWHLYNHPMPAHWDDHKSTRHDDAIRRLKKLLTGQHEKLGKYGLGNNRSLEQYQRYCDLDFVNHAAP